MDNNTLDQFANQIKQDLGLKEFRLYQRNNGDIKLDMLAVPKESRKMGLGSRAMQALCDMADREGRRIILTVGQRDDKWGTTSASRLYDFYKRFGFVQNKGRNKDFTMTESMYRNPKPQPNPVRESVKDLSFKKYLINEMALRNYQTIGDFSKNSSFRDPRDRMLIQHPKAIERVRKKFGNSDHDFDFYFVNSPKANKHTEVGLVSLDWVRQNLGDEVADAIQPNMDQDHIQVVFTNNKGSERKNMSAWMMAHRLGHAMARNNGSRDSHSQYVQASNFLLQSVSEIMKEYGMQDFPRNEREMNGGYRETPRNKQLAMMYLFYQISTFRSARERSVRDWFEVLNELIAQYLTTGKIKFNPAPKCFEGGAGSSKQRFCVRGDYEEANDMVQMLARDMQYYLDDMLSSVTNSILVM